MADGFGVDTVGARDIAQDLSAIRTALAGFGDTVATGVTGSDRVEHALHRFFTESSDNRKHLDQLLERGVGLMNGLADGAESLDHGLADVFNGAPDPASTITPTPAPATAGPRGRSLPQ